MSDVLDIHRLAPRLNRLVDEARSSTGVDGEQLLTHARGLLVKARKAQVEEPGADQSGAELRDGASGWHAVTSRELPSTEDVTCWRKDGDVEASLHGTWSDGRLRLLQLTVDDAAWGMRMTSAGASYFSTGAAVEGPADRRLFDRIKRGIRGERQRVAREIAARSWVCGRCSWVNQAGVDGCAFCGVAGVPWAQEVRGTVRSEGEHVEPVGPTHDLAVPEGYEAGAIPELFGSLRLESFGPEAAVEAARSLPKVEEVGAGTEVRGDIVLDGVDPDRSVSVVAAIVEACEQAGGERPGLAEARALVEHLPAIACRDVPASRAADIQRHLEEAGASTRFERSHG